MVTNASLVSSDNIGLYVGQVSNQGNVLVASSTTLANVSPPQVAEYVAVPQVHKQTATPLTGFSIQIANSNSPAIYLGLTPAGTLATGTVLLPTEPNISQEVVICSTQIVTALTVTPASGQTLIPTISALAVNTPVRLIWDNVAASWYPY